MTMLTLGDFKNHVDLYSADLSRWPVEKVKQALLMVENSAEAKAYFEATLKTDAALRHFDPATRDLKPLEARIMAKVAITPQDAEMDTNKGLFFGFTGHLRDLFAPGSGLLIAAVMGFVIGLSPAPPQKTVLESSFYSGDVVISGDADMYEGDIF